MGSSPLARGLLNLASNARCRSGIIPARAGFTCHTIDTPVAAWDHPRSRGVYSIAVALPECPLGSSPLARGLRATTFFYFIQSGIIPARAGFT